MEDDFDLDELMKENATERYSNIKTKGIKAKLVVAEICKSSVQKTLRKMLSPVLTKFDQQQQFGWFHSAFVIGPWYIEWNNSSLCIPRKCYSGAALIAADLQIAGGVKKIGSLSEAVDKVKTHFAHISTICFVFSLSLKQLNNNNNIPTK
jgi:hypothetical protein